LERKQGQYSDRLGKAREKLPTKTVVKRERVFSEDKKRPETKLTFEKEAVPIGEAKWNVPKKKSLPVKAVGAVKTAGVNKLHSKIHEVEHENVGTQAAHKAELMGESAYRGIKKATRSAYRFHKNRPYRRASKLETLSVKNEMKLSYQKALRDNPKLKSSPISRFFQKRSIKKDYAAALRKAKNAGKTTKKAAGIVSRAASAVTHIVRRNPVFLLTAGVLLLLVCAIMSLFTMCSSVFGGNTAAVGAMAYAAEDADIDNAELSYTEWETDLQIEIAQAETSHSGYDEYRYDVGDIGHNPHELMGYMTAVHQDFTYAEAESVLRGLFDSQYNLMFTPETEIRTRTETVTDTYTDPVTGETTTTESEVEVEYEWHILNVTLTANSFTDTITPLMNADQRQHNAILMQSKGARQYVANPFDFNWLPYVTSNYGYRIHPISGDKNYHKGIDIGLATGTEIKAGFDGTVIQTGYDADGFGNFVVVENEDGVQAKYAHCDSVSVSMGQAVTTGDVIATVGNTGNSTGPHLHLEVVKAGQYLNPIYFCDTGDDGSGSIPPGSPGGVSFPADPGAPMGDGSYTALMAQAESMLNLPYVFGAKGPDAYDCSGFVCAALTRSGVRSIATNAQGIFNASTPVPPDEAMPGDLIFFHSTYSTSNTVTHVAILVNGTTMIHAGNPIQYASFDTPYWREHFYSFGRIGG
jgi:murein DD-endopeptidase MepM/ murein hydrolase activator NlpD